MNFAVKDNSAAVIAALRAQCADGLRSIGSKAVVYAQHEINRAGLVDTGKLRHSIRYEVRGGCVYVGTNNQYAAFHELGTGCYTSPHAHEEYGVPGIHFLHHAASRHKWQYVRTMKKAMKK